MSFHDIVNIAKEENNKNLNQKSIIHENKTLSTK